jgi:uncharacterized RDD family membrane protein YckC
MDLQQNPYQPPTTEVPFASGSVSQGPLLATRGSRLAAALIDGLLVMAVVLPLQWALGAFDGGLTAYSQDKVAQIPWIFAGFAVQLAIHGYFLATRAQSVGKIIMGIKIVTLDGQNADFKRIVLRRILPISVLSVVPVVGSFIATADCLLVFRKDQRALHDQIAGTRVIRA